MSVDPILVQRILCGLAREQDLAATPIEEVRAIKGDTGALHYRFMERKVVKTADRTFEHDASTDHVDGMGDIIDASGWDLLRLKTGKIALLWGHDASPGTMGLVDAGKKNVKLDDGHRALVTSSHTFEPEVFQGSEWGKHVSSVTLLMERGDMPGVSVGFIPKSFRFATADELDKDATLRPWSYIYEEAELLELSVTPIPANPYAQERKSADRSELALHELVAAGKLEPGIAAAISRTIAETEESWLKRVCGNARTIVPISAELPWMRLPEQRAAVTTSPAKETPPAAPDFAPVLREILEPAREAMVQATTELRAARAAMEANNSKTSERVTKGAEGAQQTEGDAAITSAAPMSAGTSRESVTDDTAADHMSTAVKAATAAATKPEHHTHADGPGHGREADLARAAREAGERMRR
jgi:hypothetical protein